MRKLNWGRKAYSVLLVCVTAAIALPAQTFTTLHTFAGYPRDSANPAGLGPGHRQLETLIRIGTANGGTSLSRNVY
jgi:hypothetical protein